MTCRSSGHCSDDRGSHLHRDELEAAILLMDMLRLAILSSFKIAYCFHSLIVDDERERETSYKSYSLC